MCIDIDPTRQSASHSWPATHSPHTNAPQLWHCVYHTVFTTLPHQCSSPTISVQCINLHCGNDNMWQCIWCGSIKCGSSIYIVWPAHGRSPSRQTTDWLPHTTHCCKTIPHNYVLKTTLQHKRVLTRRWKDECWLASLLLLLLAAGCWLASLLLLLLINRGHVCARYTLWPQTWTLR